MRTEQETASDILGSEDYRRAMLARELEHRAFQPPEEVETASNIGEWLTGPVATDDYGQEVPHDASSLMSLISSLVPHPGQNEEQMTENTLGFLLPSGGTGAMRDLARGPVGESVMRVFAGPEPKPNAMARAAEQGYMLDEPMYHGSNSAFETFAEKKRGMNTGDMRSKVADWAHSSKAGAKGFAEMASRTMGGDPLVRKLVANKEGFAVLDAKAAKFSDVDVANFLLDRKAEGVRVVKILGVNDSVGSKHRGPVYAILDQGAVRDVDAAKFDPSQIGLPGLTKALAGLGLSMQFATGARDPRDGQM